MPKQKLYGEVQLDETILSEQKQPENLQLDHDIVSVIYAYKLDTWSPTPITFHYQVTVYNIPN